MPDADQADRTEFIRRPDVDSPAATVATPVVGIGASAGGLDAFTRLLQHVPADTGFGFVLIQHLDANHPSSLSEILQRTTAMPVEEAAAGTAVLPNHVYVIAPNTELTIDEGVLRLAPRNAAGLHLPCDRFLESLARDAGAGAIGVVLSGNGSDGSAGLLAIRAAGGLTFAQEPTSAQSPGMPSMAAESGGADLILTPEAIAAELTRLAASRRAPEQHLTEDEATGEQVRAICDVMHQATGIDFSLYRDTTVRRRILRRVSLTHAPDLAAYGHRLAGDAFERGALQRDLLIGVTSFFREPDSFEALKSSAFPTIVRNRAPHSAIRIWVAGCATGEEAYSILIALSEFQRSAATSFPVQLFASDISEISIDTARRGRYPGTISTDVSSERLREHFVAVDGQYQIRKELRDQCVFSRHNLLEDPPFSRLDLISCRNVLIYLDAVQRRIIPSFHYALVDSGFLLLGRAESTHGTELFTAVGPKQHLYAKRPSERGRVAAAARGGATASGAHFAASPLATAGQKDGADWSREADRLLLSRYAPAGVVIDRALNVLEIRGQTAPFLSLTPGRTSFQLLKLLPDTGLFLATEKLVRQVAESGATARLEQVPYAASGRTGTLDIEVSPLRSRDHATFLVLFEPALAPAPPAAPATPAGVPGPLPPDPRVALLSRELEEARRRLVSQLDEQSALDEEHQQITEDTLSANEELKSLAEELETAKEELESTNEELLTMNRELESRNLALAIARDLAKAIVETVGIPLMVVDGDFIVRHVNAAFRKAFQPAADLDGRQLFEVDGGAWNSAALRTRLTALSAPDGVFEGIEVVRDFGLLGTRTLVISGCRLEQLGLILLTLHDVTNVRHTEAALHVSEEQRRQSEKMEIVGRLAGGIAHDFNNLLTVILGAAGLAEEALGPGHEVIDHIRAIHDSAERAASLTEQLLSFSRRKVLQPKVFDLNPLVADFCRMLRRVVSEQVRIVERPSAEPCLVRADPAEIGRVLMNLCLNARDAMPGGGTLTLETGHITLDAPGAARAAVPPGPFVHLAVSDTGFGMDDDTRLHIFEPFFTTKDASKGAGLGLAAVLGIMQQSGGGIWCESAPGHGARFTVVLPAATGEAARATGPEALSDAPHGAAEVVLLVEDNEAVRRLTQRILERYGYVVLAAADGRGALATLASYTKPIDLLITDVLMPDMSGGQLAQQALAERPLIKVLYMSGHAEDVIVREGVEKGSAFLQKPFTATGLAHKVRDVLDGGRPGAPRRV